MVKATAGGGGMGLQVCHNHEELQSAVETVKSRGSKLFKNSGFFLEKYVENGRHIEAQIFGDGRGNILFFGERECSVQRRHQKVIEETPSPFVLDHPDLREKIKDASVMLAASVNYKSVGTVEFLVDSDTGEFFFLEMNTRLQVEHGISELCYQVDLVELMLLQAEQELQGDIGLTEVQRRSFVRSEPVGHAIEVRVYAENPAKDFQPAPGILQNVEFPRTRNVRIDTWVETGTEVSTSFDSLLAKIMVYDKSRQLAIEAMSRALDGCLLQGPPTNIEFLSEILAYDDFRRGLTTTAMLSRLAYKPVAIEIIEPGALTTVQDWPGRRNIPNGVPQSGPMDGLSLRIANLIVGNAEGTEGFEITLFGPKIKFHVDATIALCGAEFPMTIEGKIAKCWTRHHIVAGSELSIGEACSGARGYLAIRGGLPKVAKYLGSKSTTPVLAWGGYQGRSVRAGDFLHLDKEASEIAHLIGSVELPEEIRPVIENSPTIYALPGPWFDQEFLSNGPGFLQEAQFEISFNSSRTGIRLEGPSPTWSRSNGGEGGSHPSNMIGFGCSVGGVSFTGDLGLNSMVDAPNTTGFIVTHTVPEVDLRRLAQLRPGDTVRYRAITWDQANSLAQREAIYLQQIRGFVMSSPKNVACIAPMCWDLPFESVGDGILYRRPTAKDLPAMAIRQSGEMAVLCVYRSGTFDIPTRARLQQLSRILFDRTPHGFLKHSSAENASILIHYDPKQISQSEVIRTIVSIDENLPPLDRAKLPSRIIHLPAIFDSEECHESIQRYMTMQRNCAAYLPDNVDFIRRSNALATKEDVKKCFFETPLLVNVVGWMMGLPLYIPVDPRLRLNVPKYNPSRTYTKAGSLGIGGNTCSIYPNDAPGGYMLFGMTLPGCCWDTFGRKPGFSQERPWLFEEFDQIIFHEVSRLQYDTAVRQFKMGMYNIRIEKAEFDMLAYNDLVQRTNERVARIKQAQEECTQLVLQEESELYQRWITEKPKVEQGDDVKVPGVLARRMPSDSNSYA
jgi:urea carboxylase